MNKRLAPILAALMLAPAMAGGARAWADAPSPPPSAAPAVAPRGEVLVVAASNVDGGGFVDPRIGRLPLTKAPFSAFNTFNLVDQRSLPLVLGQVVSYPLPNGQSVGLTLLEVGSDGRYKLVASLDDKTKVEVTASSGDPFFLAGQPYGAGILVLGITVRR